ncbi:MAG: hypothetical protein KF819_01250 [Labilithrix sp.]|nr:hypothetical protein [Labilithrix sp.]
MALEGPQLRYGRVDDALTEDTVARALRLAREIEELLEDTRSVVGPLPVEPRAHSTRMARAVAASLVDELEVLVRGTTKTGTS